MKQLNFAILPGAALKMRLAPLSRSERITTMVEELSHIETFTPQDNLEIQLLANEGLDASHATANKLRQMAKQPALYPQQGFTALFDVLQGVGDTSQAALVSQFIGQGQKFYAAGLVYDDIKDGRIHLFAPGY